VNNPTNQNHSAAMVKSEANFHASTRIQEKAVFPKYKTLADILSSWMESIQAGTKPTRYPVGEGAFSHIRIGPGMLTLIGGPPALGKTALAMQWLFDALRATPDLRAVVVNVESSPQMLLDRQLSRLSGIDYSLIRDREPLDPHRLAFGLGAIGAVADRLAFVDGPYTLEHVAAVADQFHPGLIVLDYIQRIPTTDGQQLDARQSVSAAMQAARQFTDAGLAIMAVAALARGSGQRGSTYDGAGVASFRESSELEYGADDAFILSTAGEGAGPGDLILKHVKARHSEPRHLALTFDGAHQSFTATDLDAGGDE